MGALTLTRWVDGLEDEDDGDELEDEDGGRDRGSSSERQGRLTPCDDCGLRKFVVEHDGDMVCTDCWKDREGLR